jgi:SAM-dependent methyltransferase
MPRAAFLKAFYERHYAGPHVDTTATYARGLGAHIARSLTVPATGGAPYRILDFGGSDGSLGVEVARSLMRSGQIERAAIVVVDFVAPTRSTDERISVTAASELDDAPGPFDLVMASAVLEHIPELKPTLQALFARISPNGWFYARSPYVLPLRRILPRFDLLFPAHLHDLGPKFWNNVCRTFELDAEVVTSRPSYVQGSLRDNPIQTIVATLLKLPAHLELRLRPQLRTPYWRFVGGWEVLLRRS